MVKSKDESRALKRPPIVAILGHVDHGKTSLLDRIRETQVAAREAGGITQKIGAYQIEFQGRKITFIDTPGHQAFSAMRSRGASVADMVVLVVAADDGVMPQTLESLEHIKAAQVPFLVAMTKVDIAGTDPEKVKKQLADNGVLVEGYGGKVVCAPLSAKTGEGIKDLLEMILLLAEMEGIKGDPAGSFEAVVIEAKMGRGGAAGTLIIRNGTLYLGDQIRVEQIQTKVRGMTDEKGQNLALAEAGRPVEVLGFETPPPVGAKVTKINEPSTFRSLTREPEKLEIPQEAEGRLKVILRTDNFGSSEAIKASLPKNVFVVLTGVGEILESDILTAKTVGAQVIGFNVKLSSSAEKLAETEGVRVKTFKVIYELLEDLEKESLGKVPKEEEGQILGRALIVKEFEIAGTKIAGCRVKEGRINQSDTSTLKRGEKKLGAVKISSMKQQKTEITEARSGEEFGVIFSPPLDFKVGDVLISTRLAQMNE